MANKIKIDLEKFKDVCENQSLTLRELGRIFGISGEWARQIIIENDYNKMPADRAASTKRMSENYRKRRMTLYPKDVIVELYINQRLTTTEVGEKLGTHGTNVRIILKDYGIPIRSRSEAAVSRWLKPERRNNQLTEENLRKWYLEQDMTAQEIADMVNYSKPSVMAYIVKFGLYKRKYKREKNG